MEGFDARAGGWREEGHNPKPEGVVEWMKSCHEASSVSDTVLAERCWSQQEESHAISSPPDAVHPAHADRTLLMKGRRCQLATRYRKEWLVRQAGCGSS